MIKNILLTSLVVLATSLQAGTSAPSAKTVISPTVNPHANVVFGGWETRDNSWYSHLGYMNDLDGDLSTGGLFVRAFSGYGQYDYVGGIDGSITGTLFDADAGLGYRYLINKFVIGAYAGLHVRDRDLDGFDANASEGTDWGARFSLDVTGQVGSIYVSAIGQFSTVEEAIWSRFRTGYVFGKLTIGPEYVYMSDSQFEENRLGGFVQYQDCSSFAIIGTLGHAAYSFRRGNNNDDTSLYGGVSAVFTF